MVYGMDLSYLESLFKDFIERAKLHPAALFEQLCSLGVGPIVAQRIGCSPDDHPSVRKLSTGFIEL
jgi:hypothetical protein